MRVDFSYFERETGHLHEAELMQAEEMHYGVNHAEAGMHLLRLWRFPEDLCQAVAEHHHTDSKFFLARVCYLANQFSNVHLPERTCFDDIPDTIAEALIDSPPDTSALI